MTRRILMIAYHFPPLAGSSGIQRTLRFAQHLPAYGWQPIILSAAPRAYERTSEDLMAEVPQDMIVKRAFALDTARHLAVRGRYLSALARPDRWMTWRFDAVRQGLQMVRKYRPSALWSTYPIATAHLIGAELARRTGLPWIADFRDPMAQHGYPADPVTRQQYLQIEEDALAQGRTAVFTTPGAAAEYRQRYPVNAHKVHVIENGYDEESFASLDSALAQLPLVEGAVTLLHSGIVYPSERDPTQFMAALQRLHDAGTITPQRFRVRFRAAVAEDLLRTLAARHGVSDYIELCPPIPYREALAEMLRADALLVMQARNCNAQIPAKIYEYLRAGRPILCLTDPEGDTAGVLRAAGIDAIAELDDASGIADLFARYLGQSGEPIGVLGDKTFAAAASRQHRTSELATLLSRVVAA